MAEARWLLVYGWLRPGGIETLIVRLANHLAAGGKDVAIACVEGPLTPLLSPQIKLIDSGNRTALREGARSWLGKRGDPVVMISFDPISAAAGLAIETMSGALPPITHLSGVYHQRAYHMTGERPDRATLNRLVASAVGFDRLFFQNRETRRDHARIWKRDLGGSAIVPLAVEVREPVWKTEADKPLRIVSIGRLVDFKAYNLGAFEIVRDCLDKGIEVRWDIYGSGPLADDMGRLAVKHEVADAVAIKGELPYPDFVKTVAGYDLFVGCGTAALEAAMTGIPVLAVTDSERRASYGFLHQLPFGNTGELQDERPSEDLAQCIAAFSKLDARGRADLGRRSRDAALAYGMPAMIDRLQALAASRHGQPSRLRKRLVSALYDFMAVGPAARLARRARSSVRR